MTRTAAIVGAGLAPARAARPIEADERIHILGAAGAGASAAALHARYAGGAPSGCDPGGPSPYTPALDAAGIVLDWAHDPAHVVARPGSPPPARLAVTKALTSIDPDHPELAAARAAGIPLESWQQVVADAAAGRRLVAVAGTHGKSTTAGWLVHGLVAAGRDPAAFVGALMPGRLTGGTAATARRGDGIEFVVEADEYAGNFDPYRPSLAILTSAEWDHPDVFADRSAVLDAFTTWLLKAAAAADDDARIGRPPATPVLVANVADDGVAAIVERLADSSWQVVATAVVDQAPQRLGSYQSAIAERFATAAGPARSVLGRIVGADPAGTSLDVAGLDPLAGPIPLRLSTAGRHNAANALGVAGALGALGVPPETIAASVGGFSGVGRRLERVGEAGGVVVYDDYGHHPSAIRETLSAVRQREPGRPIWAVYEPLTYHRTAAMLDAFADALAEADGVAIADIWAGRDPDTTIVSAAALATAVARRRPSVPVEAPGSVEQTAMRLAEVVRPGDAVLVMGGGRSYRIAELLMEALA